VLLPSFQQGKFDNFPKMGKNEGVNRGFSDTAPCFVPIWDKNRRVSLCQDSFNLQVVNKNISHFFDRHWLINTLSSVNLNSLLATRKNKI